MAHRHDHDGHHHHHHDAHDHHHHHAHHHSEVSGYGLAPADHNAAARVAQWQEPHRHCDAPVAELEADFDLVEASFSETFPTASDPTSFLRLARIPFVGRHGDGPLLRLLRVEFEQVTDVGSLTPEIGGRSHRHDPLPAALVSTRRKLRFAYFDGEGVVHLSLAETRALREEAGEPPTS